VRDKRIQWNKSKRRLGGNGYLDILVAEPRNPPTNICTPQLALVALELYCTPSTPYNTTLSIKTIRACFIARVDSFSLAVASHS